MEQPPDGAMPAEAGQNGSVASSVGLDANSLTSEHFQANKPGYDDKKMEVLDDVNVAREKEINAKIGHFSSKIDAITKNSNGLRLGCLQFGSDRNNNGKIVYVPANYDFTTYTGMASILEELGIEEPDLVFHFSRNHGIVPPEHDTKPISRWIENKNVIPFQVEQDASQEAAADDAEPSSVTSPPEDDLDSLKSETVETENGFAGRITIGSPLSEPTIVVDNVTNSDTESSTSTTAAGGSRTKCKTKLPKNYFDVAALADPDDEEDSAHIRSIEGDVNNLFTAISEFKKTLFLITKPFKGNTLSEIACSAATASRNRTVTLGLFHTDNDNSGGNFTVLKDITGEKTSLTEYEQKLVTNARERSHDKFSSAWKDRTDTSKSQFRMSVPSSIFELDCVAKGEVPQKAIRVDCNFSDFERKVYNQNRHVQHIPGGLARECSHRLVFTSSRQKKAFVRAFSEFYATGYFACGGTHSEMLTAIRALKNGQPLFVIEGTGAVATVAKRFIQNQEKKETINIARTSLLGSNSASIKFKRNDLEVERFLSKSGLDEARSFLTANSGMFNNFNADAQYIIEHRDDDYAPRKNENTYIQEVKNEITKVMATAFHYSNEIGGEEKDRCAIDLCDGLSRDIQHAKSRYKRQAVFIQVLVRTILILTTASTVATVYCLGQGEDLIFNTVEEKFDCDGNKLYTWDLEGKEFCRAPFLYAADLIGLILPIIAAALQALDKSFRPNAKFANLLLTQRHLESEKFLFRARVGRYSNFDHSRGRTYFNARKIFMERCNAAYSECMKSEVKEGTLHPHFMQHRLKACLVHIGRFCKAIVTCFTCKPSDLAVQNQGHKQNFVMPSNFFVKCFRTKRGYEKWQGDQMRKVLKAYREQEESQNLDIEQQRLRNVERSASLYDLAPTDENTLSEFYAKAYRATQKEKYQIISLDEYVLLRLIPMQDKFKRLLPLYIVWRNVFQVLIIAFTALSTFLVAKDKEPIVPIALAVAAAADAFLTFFHLESRAPVLHMSASELRKIVLDIQGLDTLEKRLRSNKRVFIERSEAAIMSNYEFLAESALQFGSKEERESERIVNQKYDEITANLKSKEE